MEIPVFHIVDVFAEEKYAGNQLAVFRNVRGLGDADMQRLAKEMNYSETTLILSEEKNDGGYDVRIFTPDEEMPFAGHPTLGTAFIIQREIVKQQLERIALNLKVGQIPVRFTYNGEATDVLWMKQIPPVFGKILAKEAITRALHLHAEDIDDRFPVEEVSTGGFTMILPLKSLDAVKRAVVDRKKYYQLIADTQAKTILIFCPETYNTKNQLNVRFFADSLGVPEDSATGSANGCLAGYLVKHRYFGENRIDIRVEQGYEIGRPSLLYLQSEETDAGIANKFLEREKKNSTVLNPCMRCRATGRFSSKHPDTP